MSAIRKVCEVVSRSRGAAGALPRVPVPLLLTTALLLVGTGWLHGTWSQRWHVADELPGAIRRMDSVARTIDGWKASTIAIEPATVAQAGLAACWMRTYTGPIGTTPVTVVLMCGRAGP